MTRDTFDTAPLLNEINDCVTRGLHTILSGFMDDHRMYRETYDGVMRLPCISGGMLRSLNELNTIEQLKRQVVELQDEIVRLKNTKPVVAVPLTAGPLTVVPVTVTVVPLTTVPTAEKENITLVLEVDQFDNAEEESEEESEEQTDDEEQAEEADAIVEVDAIVKADAIVQEVGEESEEEQESEEQTDDEEQAVEAEKADAIVEDDEEELFEIEIEGVSYCTGDEDKGIIYELTADGEVGKKVGHLKGGEPFFY